MPTPRLAPPAGKSPRQRGRICGRSPRPYALFARKDASKNPPTPKWPGKTNDENRPVPALLSLPPERPPPGPETGRAFFLGGRAVALVGELHPPGPHRTGRGFPGRKEVPRRLHQTAPLPIQPGKETLWLFLFRLSSIHQRLPVDERRATRPRFPGQPGKRLSLGRFALGKRNQPPGNCDQNHHRYSY